MKIFGSISRLTSILFRKNSRDITLRPNQSTTYTLARDVQFPPGDADHVLVSANSTESLTNKTIDAASNTIQNLADANVSNTAAIAYSKLNLSGSLVNDDISNAAAIADSKLATISTAGKVNNSATTATELNTASAIVARDSSGNFTAGTITAALSGNATTATTAGNVSGVVGIVNGGTGQTTASSALNALLPTQTGNANKVLATDGSGNISWVSNAVSSSYSVDWVTGDGLTKAVTHNLNSLDVLVQVYDKSDGSSILIDSTLRNGVNTLSLSSSQAPGASGWKVLVLAL